MTEELKGEKLRFVSIRVWHEEEFQYGDYVIWLNQPHERKITDVEVAAWHEPPLVYVSTIREN